MNKDENRNEQTKEKSVLFYGAIDERTRAVVATGDAWACRFLLFALLLDVIYRGLMLKQASWDLIGLVIIGGMISSVYQYRNHVFARGAYLKGAVLMAVLGAILGGGFVFLFIHFLFAKSAAR